MEICYENDIQFIQSEYKVFIVIQICHMNLIIFISLSEIQNISKLHLYFYLCTIFIHKNI